MKVEAEEKTEIPELEIIKVILISLKNKIIGKIEIKIS